MPYSNIKESPKLENLFSLKNRTALIIGGAGLLGSEICDAFIEHKATIFIASRNQKKGSELIEKLKDRFSSVNTPNVANPLEVGMNAKITNGPFSQLVGQIDEIDSEQRIWILLNILGNQTRVSINTLHLIPKK